MSVKDLKSAPNVSHLKLCMGKKWLEFPKTEALICRAKGNCRTVVNSSYERHLYQYTWSFESLFVSNMLHSAALTHID